MKKIIFIIFFLLVSQIVIAVEYPPSKDSLIKELGQNYYDLRSKLPYYNPQQIDFDVAYQDKAKYLDILLRLLNDKTITIKKISLFESLNGNSSDTVIYENDFIMQAIINLLRFGYKYQSVSQAVNDDFKNFSEKDRLLMKQMIGKQIYHYSILYQKKYLMTKKCADILAKYIYVGDDSSKELNKEVLQVYEKALDSDCIDIGILYRYVSATVREGKNNNTQVDSNIKAIEIFKKYFEKLPDRNLNEPTTLSLFQKLSYLDKGKDNDRIQSNINKKIAQLISDDKLKLNDQPQWVRKGYLRLLTNSVKTKKMLKNKSINTSIDAVTDANNTEAINTLKNVFKKKGNLFVLPNDEKGAHYEQLSKEEKEFLNMIEN